MKAEDVAGYGGTGDALVNMGTIKADINNPAPRIWKRQVKREVVQALIAEVERLEHKYNDLRRELACPCCREGISIEGGICQECHGKALVSIAYETCRVHYKLLSEENDKLRDGLRHLLHGHGELRRKCETCDKIAALLDGVTDEEKPREE